MSKLSGYRKRPRERSLSWDEEVTLIQAWQTSRCHRSIGRLLRVHAWIAFTAARRWTANEAGVADLAQDGMIGIVRAAETFDPSYGVPFSAYCRNDVRSCVAAAAPGVLSVIDVPVRLWNEAGHGHGWQSASSDLVALMRGIVSLDDLIDDVKEPSSSDLTPEIGSDPEAITHSSLLSRRLEATIDRALTGMPVIEAEVFRRRRLRDDPESFEAICADLALTRDRARRLEQSALRRVRAALDREGYRQEIAA